MSVDLGITWRKLSDNVVENRYYWRRMDSDPLGAVYFEKNVTGWSKIVWLNIRRQNEILLRLRENIERNSMLYSMYVYSFSK